MTSSAWESDGARFLALLCLQIYPLSAEPSFAFSVVSVQAHLILSTNL
jgi:hypothetical protein